MTVRAKAHVAGGARQHTYLAVVGMALGVLGAACGGSTHQGAPSTPAGTGHAAPLSGPQIFATRCAACHGPRGQGMVGPRLAGGATVQKYPRTEDEEAVVASGAANGTMPAFREVLTPDEIRAVVLYTRNL